MITAHMLVKNEQQWVWYALASILPHVDKVLVVDTGSSDRTLELINLFDSPKIEVWKRQIDSREGIAKMRQAMVEATTTPWFLIVDGDEIWPENQLSALVTVLKNLDKTIEAVVVEARNCVGDIFHYQEPRAGRYHLLGKTGHYSIRAFRNTSGFHWQGEYPLEAWCDSKGQSINHQDSRLYFLPVHFWHTTHLKRSDRDHTKTVIDRLKKFKLELGIKTSRADIPKVFFDAPDVVPSALSGFSPLEWIMAAMLTPVRLLKRRLSR